MPERDRYIAGVPCWVDTSQPDPDAAVGFYSGLFGWKFEDVMPPGAAGQVRDRADPRRRRGGRGSHPRGSAGVAPWNTYVWVDSADETAPKIDAAGGKALMEPFDVMEAGRMARVRRSRGRRVLRLAGGGAPWRRDRQRGRRVELQRPEHP